MVPREHELAAHHGRRVRQAPGVDVEHGHHGQHGVRGLEAHGVWQRGGHGVQHGRAVRVHGALGVAGRARGVADAGSGVLVEGRPGVVAVFGSDQVFVAVQIGQRRFTRHVLACAHQHHMLDRGQHRRELLDQGEDVDVDEDDLVLGIASDPGHLLREQTRVDRVADQLGAGHAVVDLHVAIAVPGQRAHTVTRLATQTRQSLSELARAQLDLGPGGAVHVAFDTLGHDLDIAVVPRRVREQRRDHQGHVHHLAHQAHRNNLRTGKTGGRPAGLKLKTPRIRSTKRS